MESTLTNPHSNPFTWHFHLRDAFASVIPSLRSVKLSLQTADLYPYLGKRFVAAYGDGKKGYRFALFPSYLDFIQYWLDTPERFRCFFETIFGAQPMKMYFDVDMNQDTHDPLVVSYIVQGLSKVLQEYFKVELRPERDILVFASHGGSKFSYHIILDNYYVNGHLECRWLFEKVAGYVPQNLWETVDASMYKSLQQFRIYGCQKKDSGRIKTFLGQWSFFGREISYVFPQSYSTPYQRDVMIMEGSLVTVLHGSKRLELPQGEIVVTKDVKKGLLVPSSISESQVKPIMDLLEQAYPGVFALRMVQEGLIILRRLKAAFCPSCARVHEHENAFLVLRNDNDVYFSCRRGKKYLLGTLKVLESVKGEIIKDKEGMKGTEGIEETPGGQKMALRRAQCSFMRI